MIASDVWTGGGVCLVAVLCLMPAPATAEQRFDLDETYPMAPDGTIELRTRDADVTVVGSDRADVHVVIHYERKVGGFDLGGEDFTVDVKTEGGDLRIIEQPRRRASIGVVRARYDVLIEAPAAVALQIAGDDDDYRIAEMDGAISLAADDGLIRLQNCRGTEFDLAFEDGELDMDRGAGTLRLRYDDGDAEIRNAAFRRIELRINDGNLRLLGGLDRNGSYGFEFEDGDVDLQVADAHGTFSFTFADGSLDLEGGSGAVEISYDDGRARLADTSFRQLDLRAGDGDFQLDGDVPADAGYRIRLDDGSAELDVRNGGGRIDAHFDDGRVQVQGPVRLVSEDEHRAVYEWGDGEAEIDVGFNDGLVSFSARAP